MKKTVTKLFLLPMLMCICACSSLNNNKEENKQECSCPTTSKYSTTEINSGAIQVYIFTSYGSEAYYHLLETYNSPCSITISTNQFIINKEEKAYYYSMPMYQYSFVAE